MQQRARARVSALASAVSGVLPVPVPVPVPVQKVPAGQATLLDSFRLFSETRNCASAPSGQAEWDGARQVFAGAGVVQCDESDPRTSPRTVDGGSVGTRGHASKE